MPWGIGHAALGVALGALLLLAGGASSYVVRSAIAGQTEDVRRAVVGLLNIALQCVFIVPVWLIAVVWRKASWRDLGIRAFRPLVGCLGPLAFFLAAIWVELLWGLVLYFMHWKGQPSLSPLVGKSPLSVALAFAGVAVATPIAEELFFRGFLYPALRARLGVVAGLAISATFFALLHLTPTVLPPLIFLGLALGILYEASGSIWPSVFLHCAVNSMALLATLVASR